MATNSKTFRFKIPNEEVKRILVNHLLVSGAITQNEEENYSGFDPNGGSGIYVEFTVPAPDSGTAP
jgi:hypothetical protein